jgi:hypothetical protein
MNDIEVIKKKIQETIKQREKITLVEPHIKIFQHQDAVFIQKKANPMPSNENLINQFRADSSNMAVFEKIADKLMYYYFHFLTSAHLRIKLHFFNSYNDLLRELPEIPKENILVIKNMAVKNYSKMIAVKKYLEEISTDYDNTTDKTQIHKEIGEIYKNFRAGYTSYNEQIVAILNVIIGKVPVTFY